MRRRLIVLLAVFAIAAPMLINPPTAVASMNLWCNGNGTICLAVEASCNLEGEELDGYCRQCFGPTSFYYDASCQHGGDCEPEEDMIACSF